MIPFPDGAGRDKFPHICYNSKTPLFNRYKKERLLIVLYFSSAPIMNGFIFIADEVMMATIRCV